MIITRTPYRISMFGGGSDYPDWFENNGGAVLSTTIDKYCYIFLRFLSHYHEYNNSVVYSQIERTNTVEEIRHPVARECLKFMNMENVSINHDTDIPAWSGMGSSSAFTVGLLHALHAIKNTPVPPLRLAREAIYVERELIKDTVGYQDQIACALGGLNVIEFKGKPQAEWTADQASPQVNFWFRRVDILEERLLELQNHLMLVFTGISRNASAIARSYEFKGKYLHRIQSMVQDAKEILLHSATPIREFGLLLNEAWRCKKELSSSISTPYVEWVYEKALLAGADGGKLCGAGGGGFMLLFVHPDRQEDVRRALNGLLFVHFKFESKGTHLVLNSGSDI